MINPVSNVSFKAFTFWGPNYPELTESQKEIKEDIASKLVARREKTNGKFDNRQFYIKPLDKDTIELSELFRVEKERKGIKYSDILFIGEYDKNHPFEIEDYDMATKKDDRQVFLGCFGRFICLAAMLIGPLIIFTSKQTSSPQVEKATTVVKDSIQKVAKDTLQLFK